MTSPGLTLLEFDRFRAVLTELASCFLGRRELEQLTPFESRAEALRTHRIADRLRALAETGKGVPPVDVPDLASVLARLSREGGILAPPDFLELERLLKALSRIRPVLVGSEDPEIAALGEPLVAQPHLERAIEQTFEPSGELRDSASPGLRRIRRERERLREHLREKLERRAAKLSGDSVVTLRDGRYVLSVAASQRGKVKGLVQDRSASGQTFFVEPMDLVDDNNALRDKDAEERDEVHRILEALTGICAKEHEDLDRGYSALGEIDALRARAQLARRWGGQPVELVTDGRLRLTGARHPLLLEARGAERNLDRAREAVVPLNVELDQDRRLLLITGPNMGGKTVALKAVGLLSAMAACGCPIPVDPGSWLPWVDCWVVDVGDEQSLEQDLSTFGARLKRWGEALAEAGPCTLVLLDELGSGTDPTEGAALAQSVLERLVESGGLGIVTTHLGTLKEFAAATDGIDNASMLFDLDSRRPAYRLQLGIPGESHALEMARQLGFPPDRVARAEALLPETQRDVRELLRNLESKRVELETQSRELESERAEVERLRTEASAKLQRFLRDRSELRARVARQARGLLRRAEEQAQLVKQETRQKAAVPRRALAEAQARLARLEAPRRRTETGPPPRNPRVGDRFWADSLEREVELLRAPDDQGRVLVGRGALRVELPVTELRMIRSGGSSTKKVTPRPTVTLPETDSASPEVDLRGMRADEARTALETALDRSLLAGLKQLRVIHGKGTGALQKMVEEFCRAQPVIHSFRIGERGEGGSGVTMIVLED